MAGTTAIIDRVTRIHGNAVCWEGAEEGWTVLAAIAWRPQPLAGDDTDTDTDTACKSQVTTRGGKGGGERGGGEGEREHQVEVYTRLHNNQTSRGQRSSIPHGLRSLSPYKSGVHGNHSAASRGGGFFFSFWGRGRVELVYRGLLCDACSFLFFLGPG